MGETKAFAMNPLLLLAAERLSIEEIKTLNVNRQNELQLCINTLHDYYGNVLIYGSRGVGKTFFVRHLLDEISINYNDTMPLFINIQYLFLDFPMNYNRILPLSILQELCRTIWVRILKRDYTELREIISNNSLLNTLSKNEDEKKLIRIYSIIMATRINDEIFRESAIGGKLIVKADIKEGIHHQIEQNIIYPFELFEFIDEIKKYVLEPRGINKIIVICDEANKLNHEQQKVILESYLEIFKNKAIQFIFVVSDSEILLSDGFQEIVNLIEFSDQKYVKELIEKYTRTTDIEFLDESINVIWQYCKGHPRKTLDVCSLSLNIAETSNAKQINDRIALEACLFFQNRQEHLQKYSFKSNLL